jgi:hypothetical protein
MPEFFQRYETVVVPVEPSFPELNIFWTAIGSEGKALLHEPLQSVSAKLSEALKSELADQPPAEIALIKNGDPETLTELIADILGTDDRVRAELLAHEIVIYAQVPRENSKLAGSTLAELGAATIVAKVVLSTASPLTAAALVLITTAGIILVHAAPALGRVIAQRIARYDDRKRGSTHI